MNYVTLFFTADPSSRGDLYGYPVEVPNDDETTHFEALMERDVYDLLDPKDLKTFSKTEKKMLKDLGGGEYAPRHVFGPPGNLGDPELKLEEK